MGVQEYPRIASIFTTTSVSPAASSRMGLAIMDPRERDPALAQAVAALSPKTRLLLTYSCPQITTDSQSPLVFSGGLSVYPGWWLLLAPRTILVAGLTDTTTTTLQVADGTVFQVGHALLIDAESMYISGISGNTLTVLRGYYSTPSTHLPAAHVAQHAIAFQSYEWMCNVTAYCPTDPSTGYTWVQYLAHKAAADYALGPYAGVYFDNVGPEPTLINPANTAVDADNDGVADGGNGTLPNAWYTGVTTLLSLTTSLLPGSATVIGNGWYYPSVNNGQELEVFYNGASAYWYTNENTYLLSAGPTGYNANIIANADTLGTGTIVLQSMRFRLGLALLGNGYSAYDLGGVRHGQPWWFDEYDGGQASSLAIAATADDTTLTVATGTGSRYSIGDTLHVPQNYDLGGLSTDDEQMTVTGVAGDVLRVTRAINGTTAGDHPVGFKVMTMAQIVAGAGWFGQPVSNYTAITLSTLGPNLLTNPSFETASGGLPTGWGHVATAPTVAIFAQDTSTFAPDGGIASASIQITTPNRASRSGADFVQSISLAASGDYTITFWAKATAEVSALVRLQQNQSPSVAVVGEVICTLSPTWTQYRFIGTAASGVTAHQLYFYTGRCAGTLWIDGVTLQLGNNTLFRRDFQHGTVLVNGTNASQTVSNLGTGYSFIAGTQDPTHNPGGSTTTTTLASLDAVLLAWSGGPPSFSSRSFSARSSSTRTYASHTNMARRY